MAITPPTLVKSVYNRIPFLVEDTTTDELIESFAAEAMGELYMPFNILEADMLDDTKYNVLQKSLISDLVSIQLLARKVLVNSEGTGGETATGNKVLKRAKAGEAETEFHALKASDGVKLLASAESLISKFMNDALRKARTLGFILDVKADGEFVVSNMSQPLPGFAVIEYD